MDFMDQSPAPDGRPAPDVVADAMAVASVTSPTLSLRTNILDELEHLFVSKRLEVVRKDGFLSTPLHVVKSLADGHKTKLHAEVYIIHHGLLFGIQGSSPVDRFYRVEVICGKTRGIGQAPLRSLAYQLAAIDILEKIKYYNRGSVPAYGMPPGARVNPAVIRDLVQLCLKNQLGFPKIEIKNSKRPFEEVELHYCQISVKDISVQARSDSRHMARRLAALEMFNKLSNDSYPEMTLGIGNECVGLKRLKELGIQPLASKTKRDWLAAYRTASDGTSTYFPDEEPDDGDMAEDAELFDHFDAAGRRLNF